MRKIGVGIIGCGNISGIYLENLGKMFRNVEVVAVADLDLERAKEAADKHGIKKVLSTEELLADKEVEIVLNLTIPKVHFDVCKSALEAGKHVYVEKPISLTEEDGQALVDLAEEKGLLIGCAPDTFMGAGIQTAKKLIEDGWIGKPIGGHASMTQLGPERWHPNPEFFYKIGGGPMFDMGPYYITALTYLIGRVESVMGETRMSFTERIATCDNRYGEKIKVEVPTYVSGFLNFENGATCTITTSFDVCAAKAEIEIHGSLGSISVPNPNFFGGSVKIRMKHHEDWQEVPLVSKYSGNCRGYGISDMAQCIVEGRTNLKASGKQALHVLKIMHAIHRSSDEGRRIDI